MTQKEKDRFFRLRERVGEFVFEQMQTDGDLSQASFTWELSITFPDFLDVDDVAVQPEKFTATLHCNNGDDSSCLSWSGSGWKEALKSATRDIDARIAAGTFNLRDIRN